MTEITIWNKLHHNQNQLYIDSTSNQSPQCYGTLTQESHTRPEKISKETYGKQGRTSYLMDRLEQERCNSSALAMELCLYCTNPSIQVSGLKEINMLGVFVSLFYGMAEFFYSYSYVCLLAASPKFTMKQSQGSKHHYTRSIYWGAVNRLGYVGTQIHVNIPVH